MKRLILIISVFICAIYALPAYSQVSKSALITDADFSPGFKLMGGVGIGMGFVPGASVDEAGCGGFEVSLSLGSFENRFNLEFAARQRGGNNVDNLYPLVIAPRFNIVRVSYDELYFYVQPEIGYAFNSGNVMGEVVANKGQVVYGARIGLGISPIGSLYIGVLGASEPIRVGTEHESKFCYFSFGYHLHFWRRS